MTLKFPGYHITETLHRGAKSAVYRARRERDQFPVVIKATTPYDSSPSTALRLYREHEILNTIDIPASSGPMAWNIIRMFMP
jgi:serine/threonine protein kinase